MAKARPKGAGTVRQLPSGRWQARHTGPDGVMRSAPSTFDTKLDASAWLTGQTLDIAHGIWAPDVETRSGLTLKAYAASWMRTRRLRPSTRATYTALLDKRILPVLGGVPLARLTPTTIRNWHADLGTDAPTQVAQAYSLLRSICATAVEDDIIDANPCRIRGASRAKKAHVTKPATPEQVQAIADAVPDRYTAAVLLASWCALRSGELRELRRKDVDEDGTVIHVRRGVTLAAGEFHVGPTKSDAGIRDVDVPPHVVPALVTHLADHTGPDPEALLFPSAHDPARHLQPSALYKVYYPARDAAGRPDLRWHDLRHTGAVFAVSAGASLRETMARLGHSSVGAAMVYQHVAEGRGKQIAASMSELVIRS